MTDFPSLAQTLTSVLGLDRPPVAMAPVAQVPEGVPLFRGIAPSACSFWRQAEKELFAVSDSDHMNCPIGAMVMGFELTPQAQQMLETGLAMMCEVGYVKPEEAERIPSIAKTAAMGAKAILYGPLSNFPVTPEAVVIWLQPSQAMLLREATGDAQWTSDVSSKIFGRPACAALAVAAQGSAVALSFGCSGMRTFTGIEPSYMLAALSGPLLGTMEESLRRAHAANCSMQEFYDRHKSYFPWKS